MYLILLFACLHMVTQNRDYVGLLHSIITSSIALYNLNILLDPSTSLTDANSYGRFCANITLQYMCYDIIYIRRYDYFIHHVMAIFASSYVLYFENYDTLVLYIEFNELSTIFLNLMYLNFFKKFFGILFVISFVLCRVVWIAWLITTKNISSFILSNVIRIHFVLQLYWLHKIFLKLIR